MDNLSITSLVLEQPWTGTVQVCIDQAQYTELGRKIMVTIGLAFLLGFFMGELTDYVVKKVKEKK